MPYSQSPPIAGPESEIAKTRLRPAEQAPTPLPISVVACVMTVAGCARNPAQRDLNSVRHNARAAPVFTPARAYEYSEPRRYSELRTRQPDAALLAPQPAPDCEFKGADVEAMDPQPAPDCEFKGADVEAMDPAELARLKLEYERQCYQNAEKVVRDRLSLLQASSRCEIEPAQPRQSVR
jgi:hypothetical protein